MFDKFHDECGVVAIYGHPEASKLAYLGLYALQHRGQESAGISTSDGKEIHTHKTMGHVADIFTSPVLASLPGDLAIGLPSVDIAATKERAGDGDGEIDPRPGLDVGAVQVALLQ